MMRGARITAWQPPVPGLREVLHAHFPDHAYPMHTHDAWTLLIVDEGVVRYDLDRHEHGAMTSLVTLLPPNVPHDGRSVRPEGFRKRVLYLDPGLLGGDDLGGNDVDGGDLDGGALAGGALEGGHLDGGDLDGGDLRAADLTGAAVDNPGLTDPILRLRVHQLHDVLTWRTEDLEAQSRLLLIRERLNQHLRRGRTGPASRTSAIDRTGGIGSASVSRKDRGVAGQLRELLDARVQPGISLTEAGRLLHSHPTHLVRAFSREFGMPPHLYLTGRRVELARRHLLAGLPPAEVAVLAGFYDQSHLTRHFRRMLGVSPARYARIDPEAPSPQSPSPS